MMSAPVGLVRTSKQHLVALAFAVVCVVWGSTYLGIRVALTGFPPFFLGAARFLVAGVALWGFARWRGEPSPSVREWGSALLSGSLFFVIGNGLVNVAEKSVSSGLVSVLVATMPLWVTVFGRLSGAHVSRVELGGVLLGLLGVVVLNLGGELRASPMGAVCGLLAPMGWALGAVASGRLPLPRGLMRTAAQMIGGGVATCGGEPGRPRAPRQPCLRVEHGWRSSTCSAWARSSASAPIPTSSSTRDRRWPTSYAYVNPVIAVFLGVVLAGERVEATSLAGAAIVLAAVILVGRARSAAQSRESASRSRSTVAVDSSSASKRSTTPESSTLT